MADNPKVALISNYFGEWPFWFDFFIESCRRNKKFKWLIYTDCEIPTFFPENVFFFQIQFDDYCKLVSHRLGIKFNPNNPYKLCDIKPALGLIHEEDIGECEFWGYTDIDIINGNLEIFFTDEKMEKYDVISSGSRRIWGFLCLIRNSYDSKRLFQKIENWKELFEDEKHYAVDERHFSKLFVRHKNFPLWLRRIANKLYKDSRRVSFDDAWSNPGWKHGWIDGSQNYPTEWYWEDGKLTNNLDEREFAYLHFIEWKLNEWRKESIKSRESDFLDSGSWKINKNGFIGF